MKDPNHTTNLNAPGKAHHRPSQKAPGAEGRVAGEGGGGGREEHREVDAGGSFPLRPPTHTIGGGGERDGEVLSRGGQRRTGAQWLRCRCHQSQRLGVKNEWRKK